MESVRIRSYSGPHFPAFVLNNSEYGHLLRSEKIALYMHITSNCALVILNMRRLTYFVVTILCEHPFSNGRLLIQYLTIFTAFYKAWFLAILLGRLSFGLVIYLGRFYCFSWGNRATVPFTCFLSG